MKIGTTEIILFESIVFLGLWLVDEFIASILSLVFPTICFFVLIISIIAEMIEPSKVPKKYFIALLVSCVVPLIIAAIFFSFNKELAWLK